MEEQTFESDKQARSMFIHALLLCVNLQSVVYWKHLQIALFEILFLKINLLEDY